MAILNKKLKIKDSEGTTVDCNIYTTQTEAGNAALNMNVNNESAYVTLGETNGYGATKGRVKINGETHAIMSKAGLPYTEQSWTEPGTYTFTVPAGVTRMRVAVCGGGGSGGGYATIVVTGNAGEQSSFGNLIVATGGGGSGKNVVGSGGTPNGYDGVQAHYTEGFALSFEKANGEYGRGAGVDEDSDFPTVFFTGGSGGYDSQYLTVTPNETYEVKVGKGGNKSANLPLVMKDGISGFVLIAYGGDI